MLRPFFSSNKITAQLNEGLNNESGPKVSPIFYINEEIPMKGNVDMYETKGTKLVDSSCRVSLYDYGS